MLDDVFKTLCFITFALTHLKEKKKEMAFGTLSNPQFLDPGGAAGGEQSLGLFVDPPPPPPAWRWFKLFNSNVAVEIGPLHANLLPGARSCRPPAETFTPPPPERGRGYAPS